MHRLTVALLAAFDAVVAAAAGLAVALAAITALFLFGNGDPAQWNLLWVSAASVWQLGNLVPLPITLADGYAAAVGIPAEAASFTLSLAPLGFAVFTAVFAARSGVRAAGAHAWIPGVIVGGLVYGAAAAGVAVTTVNPVAQPELWQAIAIPAALYVVAALIGAVAAGWTAGDGGTLDALRARIDDGAPAWRVVPGLVARGTAMVVVALVGLGAALVAVAVLAGGGEIIALSEAAHLDVLGAIITTLATLAYLPTLIVWGVAWIAGPGFAIGTGTTVGPVGTQLGVVPGIPVLGALPETVSGWLLLVVLLPVAAGGFAGWAQRSRFVRALDAAPGAEPVAPRLVLAGATAVLAAAVTAALAAAASGGIGPGRFTVVGPDPGPVALAVGLEVLVGAAILLLSPRWQPRGGATSRTDALDVADAEGDAPATATGDEEEPVVDERPGAAVAVGADAVGRRPGATSAVRGMAPAGSGGRDADQIATAPLDDAPETDAAETDALETDELVTDELATADVDPADTGADAPETRTGAPADDDVDPATLGRHRPRPLPPVD